MKDDFKEEALICDVRGHELRYEDVMVSPRTTARCVFCNERFYWVEPRPGYWEDGNHTPMRMNEPRQR